MKCKAFPNGNPPEKWCKQVQETDFATCRYCEVHKKAKLEKDKVILDKDDFKVE